MRKFFIGATLVVATLATSLVVMPEAQAQANYPNVAALTPFTAECNYMSKPGYLRYRHFLNTGEFLDYPRAFAIVQEQGG